MGHLGCQAFQSRRVSLLAKGWFERVFNELVADEVGDGGLQATAYLNGHFAIVEGDQHEHSIVGFGLADAPGFSGLGRHEVEVVVDAVDKKHRNLGGSRVVDGGEYRFEARFFVGL